MRGDIPKPDRAAGVTRRQRRPARAVGQRGDDAGPRGQDAADRLGQRFEQAVPRLRGGGEPPCGSGQERGRDRIAGVQRRALGGQVLPDVGGALLVGVGPGALDRDPRSGQRGDDQHGQEPGQRPAPPAGAVGGAAAGPQEIGLARGQRRVPARIGGPDPHGLPGGGQLHIAVQRRGAPAIGLPLRGILRQPAVQDHARLVFLQPAAQARPGLQQDVVRDLGPVSVQDQQAAVGKGLEHGGDLRPLALGQADVQVGTGHGPARGPAIGTQHRHPPQDVPGDYLLVRGQRLVGGLGTDLDGPGHPGSLARALVAPLGQLVALAVLPGQQQGLGQQRQDPGAGARAALAAFPGRAQVSQDGVGQSVLQPQPAGLGGAGDHPAQVGLGHRPDHHLVPLHSRHQLGAAGAPIPVITANRDHHQRRRLVPRPGRPGRGGAHRVDERGPLLLRFLAGGGEDLLELVDDQDQPGHLGRDAGPSPLAASRSAHDLADQQVRFAGGLGQALTRHRRISAAELSQPGRELGQRTGRRGHPDPRPGLRSRHLHAPGQGRHQPGLQQRGLAGPRGTGHHDQAALGQQAGQLRGEPVAAVEHRRVSLVVRQQPAVGAAAGPARAGLLAVGGSGYPGSRALFDDRQFLTDHAYVGRLMADPVAGHPQLGALVGQAVLDLAGRPGQVGEQEFHLAEFGAHRLDGGQHLALQVLVARLDGGQEDRAARVDLPQHHGDIGSHRLSSFGGAGQDLLEAPADLPLQVRPGQVTAGVCRSCTVQGGGQDVTEHAGPDRGQHPGPGHGHGAVHVGGVSQFRPERGRAQQRQHRRGRNAAQLVTPVSRRPQQPFADTGLEPLNLLEIAHPAPSPHPRKHPKTAAA